MNLLEKIKMQFKQNHKLSLPDLQKEVESLTITLDDVSPYIEEPNGLPYSRKVIFQSDLFEVIVLCLPAHSKTDIHDHGQSIGCGKVIQGKLTEFSYELNEEGDPEKLTKTKVDESNIFLIPERYIHAMANDEEEKLITLHIYSPPLIGVQNFKMLSAAEQSR
ncbi:cysteine dioxygenase [Priestia abyssalis]|uniref:cysteine dioxygenase n=1 Tax=Priestia abyssalis TaxID=1221450 RepID=UPI0009952503|nr:cysteine dioxygenase family protein [Priestia abyssalis]